MRSFVRGLFRAFKNATYSPKRRFSKDLRMSNSGISAVLYAATISVSSITNAVPEEAKDKRHHLKDGNGFTNPWDSWRDFSGPGILKALIWYISFPIKSSATNADSTFPGDASQAMEKVRTRPLQLFPYGNQIFYRLETHRHSVLHGLDMPAIMSSFLGGLGFYLIQYLVIGVVLLLGLVPSVIQIFHAKSRISLLWMRWLYRTTTMIIWITQP